MMMILVGCTGFANGLFFVSIVQSLLAQFFEEDEFRGMVSSVCLDSFHSIGCSGLGFTAVDVCSHPASLCRSLSSDGLFRNCFLDIIVLYVITSAGSALNGLFILDSGFRGQLVSIRPCFFPGSVTMLGLCNEYAGSSLLASSLARVLTEEKLFLNSSNIVDFETSAVGFNLS